MGNFWAIDGKLRVDSAGRPVECEDCPPCVIPNCSPCSSSYYISTASLTAPIVIVTALTGPATLLLQDGDEVVISGCTGNTASTGTWIISDVDPVANSFSLVGSDGTGGSSADCHHGDVGYASAKSVLDLSYTGFGGGTCSDVFPNWPNATYMDYCTGSCTDMATTWPLRYIDTNLGYAQPCSWSADHSLCFMDDAPVPSYYWKHSVLFFKYNGGTNKWELHLQLWFDQTLSSSLYGGWTFFEWAIDISDGCTDFADYNCHELEGCVTFDYSNLISDGIPINTTRLNEWQAISPYHLPGFRGFNCPCSTGWAGEILQSSDVIGYVKTTSWPGSDITATITGW